MPKFAKSFLRIISLTMGLCLSWLTSWAFVGKKVDPSIDSNQKNSDYLLRKDPNLILRINKQGEVLNKRTEHSKTYYIKSNEYQLVASTAPIHFKNVKGEWEDFDFSIVKGKIDKAPYDAELLKKEVGYTISHKKDDGALTFRLLKIGDQLVTHQKPQITENEAHWKNIVEGVDLKITFLNDGAHFWWILNNADTPKTITYEVAEINDPQYIKFSNNIAGFDNDSKEVKVDREEINKTKEDGKTLSIYKDTFTEQIVELDEETRQKRLVQTQTYPISVTQLAMAKITYPVSLDPTVTNTNDANDLHCFCWAPAATPNACTTISDSLQTNVGMGKLLTAGGWRDPLAYPLYYKSTGSAFLFSGITVAQSSRISAAHITLKHLANSKPGTFYFYGKDEATPGVPASGRECQNPTGVLTVKATHVDTTTPTGTGVSVNHNVKAVVQALVNKYDYTADTMLFFLKAKKRAYGATKTLASTSWMRFSEVGGAAGETLVITLSTGPLPGAIIIVQ